MERAFGPDPSVALTLVSDTNALLFTPMPAEVAASSLEATHISSPLRTGLRRTEVIRRPVADIDLVARRVRLATDEYTPVSPEVPFDHLVLALGAVSNYLGLANVENEAFDFKTLGDATRLRNHVIDMFERANAETEPSKRRGMLTFIVAGGGFAGAELAGGLNDFARGMLAYYPNIPPADVQILLVHSRDRILPELSESLARYALEPLVENLSLAFADQRQEPLREAKGQASVGTQLQELLQDTLFGFGAIGGATQPHADQPSRTGVDGPTADAAPARPLPSASVPGGVGAGLARSHSADRCSPGHKRRARVAVPYGSLRPSAA